MDERPDEEFFFPLVSSNIGISRVRYKEVVQCAAPEYLGNM